MKKSVSVTIVSIFALLVAGAMETAWAKEGISKTTIAQQQPTFVAADDVLADDELPDSIPAVPAGGGFYKPSSLPDGCVAEPAATICGGTITVVCKNPPSSKRYWLRCETVAH
jgi:hypothetical protein